ncbi:MAG: LacI family DNA-binding transcriptional regulator [Lachnospiraceae bacterium]
MPISAKELAQKLGISAATVSMVLNKKPGISERTRNIVLDAAREYGYDFSKKGDPESGNGVIQFVIYKKHGTIVADTPFFAQLTEGIDAGCKQHGYELQITYFYENQDIQSQIQSISEKNCQGILLLGTEMEVDFFQPFSDLKIPMVLLDTYFEELSCDSVLINNVQGAYLATNYLIGNGLSEVGYLQSSYTIANFAERADGYYKALRHHKLPTNHPYTHKLTPTMEGAYMDMLTILENNASVAKAYFADNDLIAAGAMRALKEYGYRIPEDISIIGFDDMPICDFLEPRLTTMEVPKQRLGVLAVERLVSKISQETNTVIKIEVSAKLHERMSVKKK